MIGQNPISHIDHITKHATVNSAAEENDMRAMILEANVNAMIVIKEMRRAIKAADEQDDPGAADV